MANSFFQFKQFIIHQDRCAMKVTTDACLLGAWAAAKIMYSTKGFLKVLDIGAGTGLLSLMLAQKINASIDAIEIDQDAAQQAKENISASSYANNITVLHADAGKFSSSSGYDIIISNPPFYEQELRSPDKKKNIAHHGGLAIKELFSLIKKNLVPEGRFYLLLPYKRHKEVKEWMDSNELSINEEVAVRQSVNHDYFRVMLEGKHKNEETKTTITEMSIRNEQQQYTTGFIDLLKDYYLYL